MRTPRMTRVSLGYPLRRLLERSKKGGLFVMIDIVLHGALLDN